MLLEGSEGCADITGILQRADATKSQYAFDFVDWVTFGTRNAVLKKFKGLFWLRNQRCAALQMVTMKYDSQEVVRKTTGPSGRA